MAYDNKTKADMRLHALSDEYWNIILKHFPFTATDIGDHRFDDVLPDFSLENREAFYSALGDLERRTAALDEAALQGQDRITFEILQDTLHMELEGRDFVEEQWTINHLHCALTQISELADKQPVDSAENAEKLRRRFAAVPRMLEQLEERLDEGRATGRTAPRIGPERLAAQLRRMLEIPIAESSFLPKKRPESMSEGEFAAIRERLAEEVERSVYPAIARHAAYLESYLEAARERPGLCAMPSGTAWYRHLIKVYTGRTDEPEVIHREGLDELARIHSEMKAIAQEAIGKPDFRALAEELNRRPDQLARDRDELLRLTRALLDRAWEKLPDYFSRLPKTPCEVRPIEAFREGDSPSGYYSRAPGDGSRPAYYYINTGTPEHRPLYNLEALAFHEAIPGHHLQIALAQELEDLPAFRRNTGQTAYIEGWALYAERLSDEMGLYSSKFTRFGMLNYQAWRAARLVIDTGLHAMGWSREKAIQTLLEATAHGRPEAEIEVDRYIVMPGQALAYMVGRIFIDRLRAKAEARLGSAFDIRAFHTTVLENGAVPLTILEKIVNRWLDGE